MKNKGFLSALSVMALAVIALCVRTFYIKNMMAEVNISEGIYNALQSGMGSGGISLQSVYIYNLRTAFEIFGNLTVAGVYLNLFYQVVSVMMAYIIVRSISEMYLGFAAGLIAAVFPGYVAAISEVDMFNMVIFLGAVICAAASFTGRSLYEKSRVLDKEKDGARAQKGEDALKKLLAEPEVIPVQDSSMKEIVIDDFDENADSVQGSFMEKGIVIDDFGENADSVQGSAVNREEGTATDGPNEKVNYIENPLPVPKRREHKEMDYAFEPSDDDDYDLTDMTGKDFYDIE